LDHRKIGLRIRDVNGSRLITLKGPTRVDSRGISHRLEVEESWSQEALEIVMKKLKLEGVGIADSDATAAKHDPLDAMSRMGLVRIQSRKNSREVRNVISVKGALRRTVAELVIDTVTFDFGGTPIKLSEVEIEARVDTGQSLSKVADELIEVFPNELRRWSHSKLATGLALSELSKAGKLDGKRVLSADGYLLPKGYALVDSILQDRESAAS
jgi:inorganic triphosphatase YgiF